MAIEIVLYCSPGSREREALYVRPVLGVPLFVRSCLTLADQGFRQFAILAPAYLRRPIIRAWQRWAAERGLHLEFIPLSSRHSQKTISEELTALQRVMAPRFCLLEAATVVTPAWVKSVLRPGLMYHRPIPGAIGVLLRERLNFEILATIDQAALDVAGVVEPGQYSRITSSREIPVLEHFLCEHIRRAANGLIAKHVNKRISLPISRVLARLRVSPNAITVFNMLIGLAAGIGTAGVTYYSLLVGGILFQLASILDGCDGEVAKLTHRTSRFGQIIDTVSDNFALSSFFVGLMIHQYRISGSLRPFVWGVVLFVGFATVISMMLRFLRNFTNSASLATFDREYAEPLMRHMPRVMAGAIRGVKALLKKEWFSLCFMSMAIIGILPAALYITAIGSWVGVFGVWWFQRLPQRTAAKAAHASTAAPAQEHVRG